MTLSPLSYTTAPHGSCHTLKGQRTRLNTVRLAFLLTKLGGVWARCRWTPLERCSVCAWAWLSAPALLQVTCGGDATPYRTRCQSEVLREWGVCRLGWLSWNGKCFSSLIVCFFSGFHVQRNFPWKSSALHNNHRTCSFAHVHVWVFLCFYPLEDWMSS